MSPSREVPVTVVIPAYNRPEATARAVRSALAQERLVPRRVLVVDDGSQDDTARAAADAGGVVVRHEVNRGLSAARNTGFEVADTPWVALLDSDDEWLPHHLETVWAARGDHVLVAGTPLWVGEDPARDRIKGAARRPLVLDSPARVIYPENPMVPSAVMVRREAVLEAGGFRSFHGVVEDLELWIRLLARGTGIVTPRVSVLYHVHDTQMSRDMDRMLAGVRGVIAEHEDEPWVTDALLERRRGVVGWDRLRAAQAQGDRAAVVRALQELARPRRCA